MCAANRLCAGPGESGVLDLAGLNQFFHCAGNILDGHVRIDAVLIQEINALDP